MNTFGEVPDERTLKNGTQIEMWAQVSAHGQKAILEINDHGLISYLEFDPEDAWWVAKLFAGFLAGVNPDNPALRALVGEFAARYGHLE